MSICYVVLLCAVVGAIEQLNGGNESPHYATKSASKYRYNVEPQQIPGIIGSANPNAAVSEMISTMYMSVIHYNCAADTVNVSDPLLLLYGTKSWTFPIQDVNLTLSYPAANPDFQIPAEEEGYVITAFKVVLYIDGTTAKGYITDGGILKDALKLMFVCSRISSMSYEFWLHGIPRHHPNGVNSLADNFQCT